MDRVRVGQKLWVKYGFQYEYAKITAILENGDDTQIHFQLAFTGLAFLNFPIPLFQWYGNFYLPLREFKRNVAESRPELELLERPLAPTSREPKA